MGVRPKAGWNDGKLLLTASRSPASGLRSAAGFPALGGPASQRGEPRAPRGGAGQGRPRWHCVNWASLVFEGPSEPPWTRHREIIGCASGAPPHPKLLLF